MAVAWPASVNDDVLRTRDFGEGFPDRVLRSPMEMGRPKVRARYTAAPVPYTYTLEFTSDELTLFQAWFNDDIAGGALSFDFINPRTGALQEYYFQETPKEVAVGGGDQYYVTMKLRSVL